MLQNPKIRSLTFGAIGAVVGALFAELVLGEPDSLSSTAFYGLLVGMFVGGLLGSGEYLVSGNFKRLQRAAPIAFLIGAIGGGLGASFGQVLYQATSPAGEQATATEEPGAEGEDKPEPSPADASIFRRIRQAGGQEGAIEIGLEWNDTNDLDLHVVEPNGNRIYWKFKESDGRDGTGGHLDVDKNADCSKLTSTPVEHVYWDTFDIPDGEYKVFVHFFRQCGSSAESKFTVLCKYGDEIKRFNDSVRFDPTAVPHGAVVEVTSFYPSQLKGDSAPEQNSGSIFQIIGWALFGLLLGVGTGAPKYSLVAMRNAAIGGVLGGLLGGVLFVLITDTVGQSAPMVGRLIGMIVLGTLIGVMIAIVESALSAALKFISGPFEGRELLIVRPEFTLGRHELEDEYIGGDTSVVAQHALVQLQNQRHVISPLNGGVSVNGGPLGGPVELCNGDRVQLGNTTLVYRWRSADAGDPNAGGQMPPLAPVAPPPPPPNKQTQPYTPPIDPRTYDRPPVESRPGGNVPPPPGRATRNPEVRTGGSAPPPPPPKRQAPAKPTTGRAAEPRGPKLPPPPPPPPKKK